MNMRFPQRLPYIDLSPYRSISPTYIRSFKSLFQWLQRGLKQMGFWILILSFLRVPQHNCIMADDHDYELAVGRLHAGAWTFSTTLDEHDDYSGDRYHCSTSSEVIGIWRYNC